jgi:hypothetical protein
MPEHLISIPDDLYQRARQVAEQTSRQVEEVIRARLQLAFDESAAELPAEEREELKAMAYLSDDTLWTIAREQLQPALQDRLSLLLARNSQGTITPDEHEELAELVDRGDRLTLRKSQALRYLAQRGHTIRLEDLQPPHE